MTDSTQALTLTAFLDWMIAIDEDRHAFRDLAEVMRYTGKAELAAFLDEQEARVLAECEAKRRIVIEHAENRYRVDPCDAHDADGRTVPCATLLAIAAIYSSHPAYREEWKP